MSKLSAAPDSLSNASRPHSKLRARSPLSEMTVSCENAALVPASARNRPPFTCVHSHAAAPESSGAFFHDMDRERCRKRPAHGRNALRASQGVRASTFMVNTTYGRVRKKIVCTGLRARKSGPYWIVSFTRDSGVSSHCTSSAPGGGLFFRLRKVPACRTAFFFHA